ncbi:integrase [bacterium]|nr:integrase [bacterium]
MTTASRREYLRIMSERYQGACHKEKRIILTELEKNLGVHRKSAIRAMGSVKARRPCETRGRKRIYNDVVVHHVRKLWLEMGQLCSRRMKKALPRWIQDYEVSEDVKVLILRMGKSTIDKYLKPYKAQYRRHWNSGTKSGRYIKTQIPIKPLDYNVTGVGQVEADTVHHCGGSLNGAYAITLTVTDVFTSWTECRAMWGKSMYGVTECMRDIEKFLPFKINTICTDNGNEFLNHQFINYLSHRTDKVALKRGRPYRKNDQCYVEQKNFTHVRELFGWDRLERKELIGVMNDIYSNEWSILQNLFYPSMKLKSKLRIGAKYKKKYLEPETPLERVLASPSVTAEVKERLKQLEKNTNPFELKKTIETKLKIINKILNKPEGVPA